MITDIDADVDECVKILKATPYETEQVKTVSTKRIWHCRTQNPKFTVVAVDCGIKYNIIRKFNECGINVIVVPYNTSAEEILRLNPDGLFLSNGPGDPENVPEVIELVKKMKGRLPMPKSGIQFERIVSDVWHMSWVPIMTPSVISSCLPSWSDGKTAICTSPFVRSDTRWANCSAIF